MTKYLMFALTFCGTLQALPSFPAVWQQTFPASKTLGTFSPACLMCHQSASGNGFTTYGNLVLSKISSGQSPSAAFLAAGDPGATPPPPPPPPPPPGAITVVVTPRDVAALEVGKTQSFTATVSGSTQGVTWSISGGVGTLGRSGGNTIVFTASNVGNGSVVAKSIQDGSKMAIATVRVVNVPPPPPPPPPGTATLKRHESHYAIHPTNASKDSNQCKACHGTDFKGTDKSTIHGDRVFISKNSFQGPKATVTDEVGAVYTSGGRLAVFQVGTKVACAFCHSRKPVDDD